MQRWTQLLVLVRTAALGLRRSAGPTLLAIATVAVALLLGGSFGLVVTNMSGMLERASEQLQLTAYLDAGITVEEGAALRTRVAALEGVRDVAFVSAEEALERFRSSAGAEIVEGLEDNPLPASLEIALGEAGRTPEGLAGLRVALANVDGIDEIARESDWVEAYSRALGVVRAGAWVIGGVLALAALLIVASTIRLATVARRDEIDILSLVGASRVFVRTPFVLEAFVQGTLGGLLALGLLWLIFGSFVAQFEGGVTLLLGQNEARFFDTGEMVRLVAAGALLSTVGALLAVRGMGK